MSVPMLLPILLGILTASVTIAGWFASYYLAKRKEDRTRRLEIALRHLERQIEEFYGPLFNLMHKLYVCNHVQYSILTMQSVSDERSSDYIARDAVGKWRMPEEEGWKVFSCFQETYFIPLHEEIDSILKTKLYLVEGTKMPESFYQYLMHSTQERIQASLWGKLRIDTSHLRGVPFPNEFFNDIKRGLDNVMKEYERCVKSLNPKDRKQ